MYYKNFIIAALGLCSCLTARGVSAHPIPNIQPHSTSNLASFSPVFLPSLSSPNSLDIAQHISSSPLPNLTSTPNNGLVVEREKCRNNSQGKKGEILFCEGKVLVKYNRRDEARELLMSARDTFLANGKRDKAQEVEDWAAQNGSPLK
jgi:hypothetical protein